MKNRLTMKKLLLLLIALTTLTNFSYASFPVAESLQCYEGSTLSDPDDGGPDAPWQVFVFPWLIPLLIFLLIRGYRRDVPWIRNILRWKNIWWLLLLIPLSIILALAISGGPGIAMGG